MKPTTLLTAAMALMLAAPIVNAKPYVSDGYGSVVRNQYGECWQNNDYVARDQTIECGAPDADGDGVPDLKDHCPGTPKGAKVDAVGCSVEADGDGDGVSDARDACPDTPKGNPVDARGCTMTDETPVAKPVKKHDYDNDGVYDAEDACPHTPAGHHVTPAGCSVIKVRVYFDTDQSRLSETAKGKLEAVASALGDKGITNVTASGYADPRGNVGYNKRLSMKRAESVKAFLVGQNVAGEKIAADGEGEVDSGNLAQDRRVDVIGRPFGY